MSDRLNIYASDAAREAAAIEIAKFVLDDAGIHDLIASDPSGTIHDATNRAIDAFLAKALEGADEKIAEIRGFKDLFSGAYNISQSLLSAADKFEVGEINAVALFQLVRRDGELLHQIAEEAPPSKLLDDTISHITAIEADRDRMRELLKDVCEPPRLMAPAAPVISTERPSMRATSFLNYLDAMNVDLRFVHGDWHLTRRDHAYAR